MDTNAKYLIERLIQIYEPATVIAHDETCPFCGSEPNIPERKLDGVSYSMGCTNEDCAAQPSVSGLTAESALARWNGRK